MGSATSGNWGHGGRPGERGGSAPGGGGFNRESPARVAHAREKIILDFHGRYGGAPVEHIIMYKDGKKVNEGVGTGHNCKLTCPDSEIKDSDLVHNHPNDSPGLSPEDIYNTARLDAKSITADTNDRGAWTLTRPENGWSPRCKNWFEVNHAFQKSMVDIKDQPRFREELLKVEKNPNYYDDATNHVAEWASEMMIKELGLTVEKSGSMKGETHLLAGRSPDQEFEKMLLMAGQVPWKQGVEVRRV